MTENKDRIDKDGPLFDIESKNYGLIRAARQIRWGLSEGLGWFGFWIGLGLALMNHKF